MLLSKQKFVVLNIFRVCFHTISLIDIIPTTSACAFTKLKRKTRVRFADNQNFMLKDFKKMTMKLITKSKCFGGEQCVYNHQSETLGCDMKFGVYLPPAVTDLNMKCPVLYFLSGLTCTHENFIQKSGMQQYAAQHGLIIVNPDTSPRGVNISGEDDSYDFGSGAGFYVDATENPWAKHYKMYSYVTKELVQLVDQNLPVLENKKGIFGHSMGGHGALLCALKNPGAYLSVSAFAPIANAMECPWGQKALEGYLGPEKQKWSNWDATRLAESYQGPPLELFIDQGSADDFLQHKQLLPDNLLKVVANNSHLQSIYKLRESYDHSYFYIASFIGEHIAYHAKLLKA